MLKGVNKQMIEVVDTGSIYFERAILIVNPKASAEPAAIYDEAARMFSRRAAPEKKRRFRIACGIAGAAAAGAGITGLLMNLL